LGATSLHFKETLPTLLLNSHHDTVKPNQGYTFEPFSPFEHQGKIYGLGSNDAGGSLVSLLAILIFLPSRQTCLIILFLWLLQKKKFRD
jgi:acetylornithine deacetylase